MKSTRRLAGRTKIAWTLAAFVFLQLALNVVIERRQPEIYDPEYRDRLLLLRQRVTALRDQPLLLVVGSSRIITDFRPETLPPLKTSSGERVLPFNFSHSGAGPLLNLLAVQRLLREGFQPRWLVIEVVPPLLGASGQSTAAALAETRDLPLLGRYLNPWKLAGRFAWERALTGFSHRDACLRYLAPWCLAKPIPWDAIPLEELGGTTAWLDFQTNLQDVERRTAVVRAEYYAGLQHFHIADGPDRALRELLDLCCTRKIRTTLLLTPESSIFRSWYAADTTATLRAYSQSLAREYGIQVVDAREWLADDAFIDGHHIFPTAAQAFTARLNHEVLLPLMNNAASTNDPPAHLATRNRQISGQATSEESEMPEFHR